MADKLLWAACTRIGVEGVSTHSFRRTALTRMHNLSKLLDLAIKGEEIVITQDDRPVAKISPLKKPLKQMILGE